MVLVLAPLGKEHVCVQNTRSTTKPSGAEQLRGDGEVPKLDESVM